MADRLLTTTTVVVTGPHGAGSSTIAAAVAARTRGMLVTPGRLTERGRRDGWLTPHGDVAAADLLAKALDWQVLGVPGRLCVLDDVGTTAHALAQLADARPPGTGLLRLVLLNAPDIKLAVRKLVGNPLKGDAFVGRLQHDRHDRLPALRDAATHHRVPTHRVDAEPAPDALIAAVLAALTEFLPPTSVARPPSPRHPSG